MNAFQTQRMNLSLIDLADTDSRASESPGVTRTPTPSASYWDTRAMTPAQAADLHAALSSLPKSFSSQLRKGFISSNLMMRVSHSQLTRLE